MLRSVLVRELVLDEVRSLVVCPLLDVAGHGGRAGVVHLIGQPAVAPVPEPQPESAALALRND